MYPSSCSPAGPLASAHFSPFVFTRMLSLPQSPIGSCLVQSSARVLPLFPYWVSSFLTPSLLHFVPYPLDPVLNSAPPPHYKPWSPICALALSLATFTCNWIKASPWNSRQRPFPFSLLPSDYNWWCVCECMGVYVPPGDSPVGDASWRLQHFSTSTCCNICGFLKVNFRNKFEIMNQVLCVSCSS